MKILNTYVEHINESVRDLMKEKSNDEILKSLGKVSMNDLLRVSCVQNFIYGVKLALKNGADPSIYHNCVIRWASEENYPEIVELLLYDPRVDPSDLDNLAFRRALQRGNTEIIKLLLNHYSIDPSYSNNDAIRFASKSGYMGIVKLLLQDNRVKRKLTDEEIEKYESKIKRFSLNESVRDLMKGKSDEEVLNTLDHLMPYELLKKSCEIGLISGVKLALERGVDPSINNNYAIRSSSYFGNYNIVELLLNDPRVDPSDCNNDAIKFASNRGHIEIVKLLLQDERVDPSIDNNFIIKTAGLKKQIEIIKLLLQDKRVVNKMTDQQINFYKRLIGNVNESVKNLMKGKTDEEIKLTINNLTQNEKNEKLIEVISKNDVDLIRVLVECGADINYKDSNGRSALINASYRSCLSADGSDCLSMIEYLIKNGANIDEKDNNGDNSLLLTTSMGSLSIVKCLVENGASPNVKDKNGITPLMYSIIHGSLKNVEVLLKHDADPNIGNNHNQTSLTYAVYYRNKKMVELLIENGADINVKDDTDKSLLSYAKGKDEIIEILKEHGAKELNESVRKLMKPKSDEEIKTSLKSISKEDIIGNFLQAIGENQIDTVKVLLNNGVDVNDKDVDGWTGLLYASVWGHTNLVRLFIKLGANVNEKYKNGNTSLMYASDSNYEKIVELLLKSGADVNIKNDQGNTALTYAERKKHWKIIKLLKDYGAKE